MQETIFFKPQGPLPGLRLESDEPTLESVVAGQIGEKQWFWIKMKRATWPLLCVGIHVRAQKWCFHFHNLQFKSSAPIRLPFYFLVNSIDAENINISIQQHISLSKLHGVWWKRWTYSGNSWKLLKPKSMEVQGGSRTKRSLHFWTDRREVQFCLTLRRWMVGISKSSFQWRDDNK